MKVHRSGSVHDPGSKLTNPLKGVCEQRPGLAIVMPVRRGHFEIPAYLEAVLSKLDELDISTEVLGVRVRPLVIEDEPPPGRRALLPSTAAISVLARSRARVFLCMEYSFATLVTAMLGRLRGRATVIFQEHRGRTGVTLVGWERRYRRILGRLAHAFVANTDGAYIELTETLGVPPAKVFRATLLVPPDRGYLKQERSAVPRSTRRPVFLFVGRLLKRKNVGALIDAAIALRSRGLKFEVWIVGEGPQRSPLEAKANDRLGHETIRFLGARPNTAIGWLYEQADVFVMPSLVDYRSVAVLEALRFGVPAIVSARDGNAGDFVRDGITGLVFDPELPGALEAVMERVITDAGAMRTFRQRVDELMGTHTPETAAVALRDIVATVRT